jgi:hypothetical protein
MPAYYWLVAVSVSVVAIWLIWGRKFSVKQVEDLQTEPDRAK